MVQLIRGLPAWFIAMHSLTIHHLLAPLIILAKDNYTAQRCTAERNVEQLSDHLNNNSEGGGGEGETSVQGPTPTSPPGACSGARRRLHAAQIGQKYRGFN